MNMAEQIFEQVKTLPETMAREVLDFVGYLKEKREREGVVNMVQAQAGSSLSAARSM